MSLISLLIVTISLTIVAYCLGGREISYPAVLFCLGFVPATFCALAMSSAWELELDLSTLLTIGGGLALFIAISALTHRLASDKLLTRHRVDGAQPRETSLPVKLISLLLFFGVQLVALVWVLVKIKAWYPDASLFAAIGYFKDSNTFTTENLSFGFPLKQLVNLCKASGYLFSYLFAEQVVLRKPRELLVVGINLVLSSALGFVVGGRFLGLGYTVCAVICILILRVRRGEPAISKRGIVAVGAVSVLFILLFQILSFGRSGSIPFIEYLSLYLGAPISNLNAFLRSEGFGGSVPFGRMTFFCWYTYLGYKLGIVEWQYVLDLPFQSSNGHDMGNVYTTFYSFMYDFGWIGAVILVALMALISQLVYERAKLRLSKRDDLWVLMSAFIAYQLLFSFFSDKFYEEVLTPGFITTSIYLLAVRCMLCRIDYARFKERAKDLRHLGRRKA